MNTIRQTVNDEAIRWAVADELEWTPDVNALRIGVSVDEGVVPHDAVKVEVRDGVVVLTGEVQWDHQRRAASRAVQRLTGVRKVDNRMTLKRRPSGTDTRERIEKALIRNAIVESNAIDVTVEGNTVTLTGTVGSWAEKTQSGLAAWSSPHVDRVNNQIMVGPI